MIARCQTGMFSGVLLLMAYATNAIRSTMPHASVKSIVAGSVENARLMFHANALPFTILNAAAMRSKSEATASRPHTVSGMGFMSKPS